MKRFLFIFCIIFCVSGCGLFNKSRAEHPSKEITTQEKIDALNSYIVHDDRRLFQGGKLVVAPFNAGEGISVDEIERFSLMMARGIVEGLESVDSAFELMISMDMDDADTVLHGHIFHFKRYGLTKKWLGKKKDFEVGLEGVLRDLETGDPILTIKVFKEFDLKKIDMDQVAYHVGLAIGSQIPYNH